MPYVNLYNAGTDKVYIKKLVKTASHTYALGNVDIGPDSARYQPFIAQLDPNGYVNWQRRYIYPLPVLSGGGVWSRIHFSDIVEITGTGDLVVLAYDANLVILLKLSPDGQVIWSRKLYDKKDTPVLHGNIDISASLHGLSGNTLIVRVQENHHGVTTGLVRSNHVLLKINHANGSISASKHIYGNSPYLYVHDEDVKNDTLHLYGRFGSGNSTRGAIVLIDSSLNISLAAQLQYNGTLPGTAIIDIHAASPVYNGKYAVLGRYRFTEQGIINKSFIAEINAATTAVLKSRVLSKDYSTARETLHYNQEGLFYSDHTSLYKFNSGLTASEWAKRIYVGDINYSLTVNKSLGNTLDSFRYMGYGTGLHYAIASTGLEYGSCKTEIMEEEITLSPVNLALKINTIPTSNYLPNLYPDPVITFAEIPPETTRLCPQGEVVEIDGNTLLQSPNFYLQTAGSTGADSTKGIHARWIFRGELGENHLPKGNLATNMVNFNQANDFVRLYRTPYFSTGTTLDFATVPSLVSDASRLWIYRMNSGQRVFHVYFRNAARYNTVRLTVDPLTAPLSFMEAYGSELIEIENKKELFFAGRAALGSRSASGSGLQLEILSVSENLVLTPKTLSFRKTFLSSELDTIRWEAENGRTVRVKATGTYVRSVTFEFYSDFIEAVNAFEGWQELGEYALSVTDTEVYEQLEPEPGLVHGNWLRYNDGAYVRIYNYNDRWARQTTGADRNLKQVVSQYIALSNNADNPKADEAFSLIHPDGQVQPGDSPDDMMILSNLDLLKISSYDFHIARMLGLGMLDYGEEVWSGRYIYLAEYRSNDGFGGTASRGKKHLSMGLPTSIEDQRLPLPVTLDSIVPGAFIGTDSDEPSPITGENGYTFDGKKRLVTLYPEYFGDEVYNPPFYSTPENFDKAVFTYPVYAGIEYRKVLPGATDTGIWEKPELAHDPDYMNVDTAPHSFETVPIALPESPRPVYIHEQSVSGRHYYGSYGINWFSRAVSSGTILDIHTLLKPANPLQPPYEINPFLIIPEIPPTFTSQQEQVRLSALQADSGQSDKTLVRLPFCYDASNELLEYKVPYDQVGSLNPWDPDTLFPDAEEIFAHEIEIFFRSAAAQGVTGKALSVADEPSNPLLSVITTGPYTYLSNGETVTPHIPASIQGHFIGSSLVLEGTPYIIHAVTAGDNPVFTVYKKEISEGIVLETIPSVNADALQAPEIQADGLFHTAENMQSAQCWGGGNPLALKVWLGSTWHPDFLIHREVIQRINDEGVQEMFVQKTRGFWKQAAIAEEPEIVGYENYGQENQQPIWGYNGLYKITFTNFKLPQHIQYAASGHSVEWWNGILRLFTQDSFDGSGNPVQSRKVFRVVRTENIGENQNLILYVEDPLYNELNHDRIKTGTNMEVNYYPGYKVYLYASPSHGLTQDEILPGEGENMRYSIFGLRGVDTDHTIDGSPYRSRISVPALMFAREIIEAQTPEQPKGALYATRPDFFGRSTYTLTTGYRHKPYGVLFYRANDEILLNTLYQPDTVSLIRENLKLLGGQDEEFFTNRWENFLDFAQIALDGDYKTYPPDDPENETEGYKFPNPDKPAFFDWANGVLEQLGQPPITQEPGTLAAGDPALLPFVKGAIYYGFVPLTEMPVIYQHIPPASHQPVDEKQVVKDKDGYVIPPSDSRFRMAPMMRIYTGAPDHSTLFTDFHLDGYSGNFYFYGVREVSSQMKMGGFSPFLGPVKLVNANPPEAPEVIRIIPVLENPVLGILPHVQLEINAYPENQNIRKINLYRTFDPLKAGSVRSMEQVKVVDLEEESLLSEAVWTVTDDFGDLPEIRYGDGIYYRLTVSRKIEYAKALYDNGTNPEPEIVIEYAPSQASKVLAATVPENTTPPSPLPAYTATEDAMGIILDNVVLQWDKQVYNGKYHLYKMNTQGNWVQLGWIQSNEEQLSLPLAQTSWDSGVLTIKDDDGNPVYHHFKVVTENTAGMMSTEERLLTIPETD